MYQYNDKIITFLPPHTIEREALQQLINNSESPVLAGHFGKGSTVGSVIPTVGGIITGAVGVGVMENSRELVKIKHSLKQIVNIKGN